MSESSSRLSITRFAVLLGASLLILVLNQTGRLDGMKDLVLRPLLPLQSGLTSVGDGTQSLVQSVRDLGTLRQRNRDLQQLVDRLTVENVRLKDVEIENATVRRLLRFRQANPSFDVRGGQIIGRVVARDPTILSYLQIDLGRDQGIAVGMPVMSDVGLVGRIIEVNSTSSKVLLITDAQSSVNAIIQGSRLLGVMSGVDGGNPRMNYLTQDVPINPGDIVLTSGLGGNFPKGLVIGQVVNVERHDYEMFQQAEVRPTVNFGRLEMVLVITNFRSIQGLTPPGAGGN